MKHLFSAVVISLSVFTASFTPIQAAASEQIKKELMAYNDNYNDLVANYDLEAFVGLYNESPLWIAPSVAVVAGLDVPRNTFQFITEKKGLLTHTFDHFYASDDGTQAVMIGQYDVNIEAVGKKATGTYLFVLEKDEGNWKIVVDMFNEHAQL